MSANHSTGKMCISFLVISLSLLISTSEGCFCYPFFRSLLTKSTNEIKNLENTMYNEGLQSNIVNHQAEVAEFARTLKQMENDHAKASKLVIECEKNHSSLEIEELWTKYESLSREDERNNEKLTDNYNNLLERIMLVTEMSNSGQQELNKERLINSQLRMEKEVLQKVHDACEARLAILRQETQTLQLKIMEKKSKIMLLAREKVALVENAKAVKNLENALREDVKLFVDREDKIKSELRKINQTQLDDVAKSKLKECQEQLDAVKVTSQSKLETKQRAMAQCTAKKIKANTDKHQLEMNLLEKKCSEEKRSIEIRLDQESRKATMLEVQLNDLQLSEEKRQTEQFQSAMLKQCMVGLDTLSDGADSKDDTERI